MASLFSYQPPWIVSDFFSLMYLYPFLADASSVVTDKKMFIINDNSSFFNQMLMNTP